MKGSKCEDENEIDLKSDIIFNRVHDPTIVILGCKGTLLNATGLVKIAGRKTPA